jgi:hypothetical protein
LAATTVTQTLSSRSGSTVAPKMMLASASAASATTRAASLTSNSDRSGPPVMPSRMPRAPSIGVSSSGEAMAASAASVARFPPPA